MINDRLIRLVFLARLALAFLWIFTGLTSLFVAPEIGYEILSSYGISGSTADILVNGGSFVDIVLGMWVATGRWLRVCCIIQIIMILIYTLLLSIINASFWFHPFGPLTKNIPIVVLILVVFSTNDAREKT